MKVNVTMFGDANKQITDNELLVAKDFILQDITLWMRWCGVDKVSITRPRPGLALSSLQWAGEVSSDRLPKFVMDIRPYALLNIIKTLMDICNISMVEIQLSDDEQKERVAYWGTFSGVKVENLTPPGPAVP